MKSEYNTSFYDDESRRCSNCGEEFKVPYVVSNPEVVSVESQN